MELFPLPSSSASPSAEASLFLSVPPIKILQPQEINSARWSISRRRICDVFEDNLSRAYSLDQGVDPRNERSDLRFRSKITKCTIKVTDYSENDCQTTRYSNEGLIALLKRSDFQSPQKGHVRWINVAGISWDVVKQLALQLNLHPLSVEDVMTDTQDKSFKIDYYQQHLFAQLTSFTIARTLDVDPARLFVFILKDGTLVTIHQSDTLYGSELTERLKNPAALMRIVADPSMLFHGHLDLIGDHLLTIVDEYQRMILELERSILLKPTLVAVQSLHLILGDIRLLHMAIKPLERIIYRLRRYDRDRYKAVASPGNY
ncbi:CorA-like magnesium transporter protein [Rhizoctonia solani]|uniref:CorA-like magnesium transporter protein n=1 Tax=Rhizoctonia solani TaxID=456999 RepID=A0A8H8NNW0_9AGAM|nr:CorA-like magnesium transporter protein [Rhizoctonia solani]QRW15900.1 CorA-like magnesium transporter protein [Rhizoctonia solani]